VSHPARGIRTHEAPPATDIPGWVVPPHPTDLALAASYAADPDGSALAALDDADAPALDQLGRRPGYGLPAVQDPPADLPAIAEPQGEYISREATIQLRIEQVRGLLRLEAYTKRQIGDHLAEVKALADPARFESALAELEITQDTAIKRIKVALAVRQLPALTDLADRKWSHALALIEGIEAEHLERAIAPDGSLPLDEIDRLSVPQLRRRAREANGNLKALVDAQLKVMSKERDAAVKEAAALRDQVDPTWTAMRDGTARMRGAAAKLADEVRLMTAALGAITGDDPVTRVAIEAAIRDGADLFRALWSQYQERAANDWPTADDAD
jgi:ElaB/YqjD/DUF883 family membrane-anchored ribosome-binding protein